MTAYPPDLPIELDRFTRVVAGGFGLLGGEPRRFIRLSPAGLRVVDRLRATGPGPSRAAQRLARRLVDAGLAHPRPGPAPRGDVTVIVPVRDRAAQLDSCLAAAGGPAIVVDDGSRDPAAIAAVCVRHGARLVRREVAGGPAAARNAGLAAAETPLVAFVDSDCRPEQGWLDRLVGHFADPVVAAVAPRVRPVIDARGPVARFAAARSPIDLGDRPARVIPFGKVSYVPTATMVVRRAALGTGFDERLRFGEDVDLVWRLHEAGWTVRFDPAVCVRHEEPVRCSRLLARHYRYGTGAAALARRHPGRVAPLLLEPWSAAIVLAALTGRARLAAALIAARSVSIARVDRHLGLGRRHRVAWPIAGAWHTALGVGRVLTTFCPGALVGAAVVSRRRRPSAVALLAVPPLAEWWRRRPALDPVRWTALCVADDAAYGLGVWVGCLRERTLGPIVPAWRPRLDASPGAAGSGEPPGRRVVAATPSTGRRSERR